MERQGEFQVGGKQSESGVHTTSKADDPDVPCLLYLGT